MVWTKGQQPLGAVLNSSVIPGQLSQWLYHGDNATNILWVMLLLLLLSASLFSFKLVIKRVTKWHGKSYRMALIWRKQSYVRRLTDATQYEDVCCDHFTADGIPCYQFHCVLSRPSQHHQHQSHQHYHQNHHHVIIIIITLPASLCTATSATLAKMTLSMTYIPRHGENTNINAARIHC